MKILHLMLSNFYIEDYNYQENALPRQNALDGHEVRIIASTETFVDNQNLGYVTPCSYINKDGIEVRRIPYSRWLPHFAMKKIRSYPGVYEMIGEFAPDVILFHGIPAWELLTVVNYKRAHPDIHLFVDSHEDQYGSALNLISKWVLHNLIYRLIILSAKSVVDKFLYITYETKDFVMKMYGIPEDKLEFYPLGGTMFDPEELLRKRNATRSELGMSEENILFVHTGKMDALKRTEEIVRAFSSVNNERMRLVLVGSMTPDVNMKLAPLIKNDPRVSAIGWKQSGELLNYLCACDMYLQPGSQSATLQNALCACAPVMIYPLKSHIPYLKDNGYFVETLEDMKACFKDISACPAKLKMMSKNSEKIARELLDYRKLAARLYQDP